MKNIIRKTFIICFLVYALADISFGASKPEPSLAVRVADAVLQRWPDPTAINRKAGNITAVSSWLVLKKYIKGLKTRNI